MKNKSTNQEDIFVSEEEKTLNWSDLQSEFKKNFGEEVYSSWLKNISLVKEYNDYLILVCQQDFLETGLCLDI